MISRFPWLLCLLALTLFGQGERGTFNGTIADPSGAVIPGATVKALNLATNVETPVETTSAGVFRMPYLSPGTYRITASAPGFKTSVRDNVNLAVAQTLTDLGVGFRGLVTKRNLKRALDYCISRQPQSSRSR